MGFCPSWLDSFYFEKIGKIQHEKAPRISYIFIAKLLGKCPLWRRTKAFGDLQQRDFIIMPENVIIAGLPVQKAENLKYLKQKQKLKIIQ